ncbi:MAG: DNA repair protein RecN [Vulcanimicrobiaceae bacterium]
MLRRLSIVDYGLIARAELEFSEGSTIFSGETGSGKTMLLGALAFVLGAKADAEMVRRGCAAATVALSFDPDDSLRAQLNEDGFPLDPGEEATLTREITERGKSSLRINGMPAAAAYARRLCAGLVDIVGQHEAQRLLSPAYHLELLDRYGGPSTLQARAAVERAHAAWRAAQDARRGFAEEQAEAHRRYDEASIAYEQIGAIAPELGEELRLDERRRYLQSAERIGTALRIAHDVLVVDDAGASNALGVAATALGGIASINQTLASHAERARGLQSDVTELAGDLARELDGIDADPQELEAVGARLDDLATLKRRYGGSLEAVIACAQQAQSVLDAFQERDRRLASLQAECDLARGQLEEAAKTLGEHRQQAALRLAGEVRRELAGLALGGARFEVQLEALSEIGASGAQRAQFLFAANTGQPLHPLTRVASGGELSRILLALVVTLAAAREPTTLVFDEIDAGVGGVTASAVGVRLKRLARSAQVVCVTHVAQIAAYGDTQLVLEKVEEAQEVQIGVRALRNQSEREAELARMLSGETHDIALKHARRLLQRAHA